MEHLERQAEGTGNRRKANGRLFDWRNYLVDNDIKIFAILIYAARWPLILTALSMPLAVFFGLILALMRMSRSRVLSWLAAIYIEVMRGTPLYVQLFLVYYTLPQIGLAFHTDALTLDPFPAAIICLTANYAAYEAEIHRAGLQAVDKGQREAALSIGMSEWQAFFLVMLPQAFRIILPPVINDAIAMLKDSCLASAIGVMELLKELLRRYRQEQSRNRPAQYVHRGGRLVHDPVAGVLFTWANSLRKQTARQKAALNCNSAKARH